LLVEFALLQQKKVADMKIDPTDLKNWSFPSIKCLFSRQVGQRSQFSRFPSKIWLIDLWATIVFFYFNFFPFKRGRYSTNFPVCQKKNWRISIENTGMSLKISLISM
jgi:hypothetical protein